MDAKELYKQLTSNMSAEDALLMLLEGSLKNYEYIQMTDEEGIHPIILVSMAAVEMNWNIAISQTKNENDDVEGMIIGTPEYIERILGLNSDENCCGNGCKGGCNGCGDSEDNHGCNCSH